MGSVELLGCYHFMRLLTMVDDFMRRERAKAKDGTRPTEAQRAFFNQKMIFDAIVYARSLCWQNTPDTTKQAAALLDAFHNLPQEMYTEFFRWSWTLTQIEVYYFHYPDTRRHYPDFLAMFDEVLAMK